MQSMQRQFGRMTTKRSADDSQVAVLLKDIKDADQLLTQVRWPHSIIDPRFLC